MPPKKRQCYRSLLQKRREASRIRRLQETDEQRERRRSEHRTYAAQSRAQSRDLFTRQFEFEMCEELYEIIRNLKTKEGRLVCESFIRAPNRWSLADYYEIVTSPIDLLKIQQKLKTKEYITIQLFVSDIELLVTNAKSYYKKSSQEYQDACTLWKVFSEEKILKEEDMSNKISIATTLREVKKIKKKKSFPVKSLSIDDLNESEPEDAQSNPQWLLYETVKNFINSQGYQLSELFWMVPSPRFYPDYYNEVKQPISLHTIKTKIKQHQYSSLSKVVADMNLMFKYAKMYNTADSKVFKGAVKLEEVMQAKAEELAYMHMKPPIPRKINYEQRAQKLNKETQAHLLSEGMPSPSRGFPQWLTSDGNGSLLYECLWDNCDHKFDDKSHLIAHVAHEPNGHIRQTFKMRGPGKVELQCLWYNCQRIKKNFLPFPNVARLISHVKVVHLKMLSKNILPEHRIKKEGQPYPTTSVAKHSQLLMPKPSTNALGVERTMDYLFEGKCRRCNFSDMQVSTETRDGLNVGLVLKCTLCPTTKVIGLVDPSIEDTHTKSPTHTIGQSQVPPTDFPQVASIKQEFILPDDGMNPSLINSSSEPTRVEMMFCVDQDESATESGSMPSDTCTAMDVTNNITAPPDAFAHTQTSLQMSHCQLSLSTTMDVATSSGIDSTDALPVDLSLVKKEVDEETLCH